jgi:5-methylcytosine-specific restriction endonuclease McrA
MDPRVQFNQWRNSREGREWKKKQYQEQQQSCAICKEAISLRNAQVDHIKPIADYPELSTEPSNLRLTCQHCNLTRPKKPTFSS